MFSQNTSKDLALKEKWEKYKKNILDYIEQGNELILKHNALASKLENPAKGQNTIPDVEKSVNAFFKIINDLPTFYKLANKSSLSDDEKKIFKNDIQNFQAVCLERTIQMNKILANKLSCKVSLLNNLSEKKRLIQRAYDIVQQAIKLREDNLITLPDSFDPGMEDVKLSIYNQYYSYFPERMPKDPINLLLIEARKINDIDQAHLAFTKALELSCTTTNYDQQFDIAFEQSHNISRLMYEQGKVKEPINNAYLKNKYLTMLFEPLMLAAELKLSEKVSSKITRLKIELLYNSFSDATNIFYSMTFEEKNVKMQVEHLNKAFEYNNFLCRLALLLDKDCTASFKMHQKIRDCIKIISDMTEIQEKEALTLENCMNEYNQNFHFILEEFENEEKKNSSKFEFASRKPRPMEILSEISSSSSEEEEIPIIQKPETTFIFELDENIRLLQEAENNHDIKNQICLNINISDYYRVIAIRQLNKKPMMDLCIKNLKQTLYYLLRAIDLIHEVKKQNHRLDDEFFKIEKCAQMLINDTRSLLDQALTHQTNIKLRYEESRKHAMKIIIKKHGPQGWFKETFDESGLSIPAKMLRQAKNRILILEKMHGHLIKAHEDLNKTPEVANVVPLTFFQRRRSWHGESQVSVKQERRYSR